MKQLITRIIMVALIITSACLTAISQPCLCTNQSLMGTNVSTRFGVGPLVNNWVGSNVEMVGAGPMLGYPGTRWDIDFSSNIIRIRFVQAASYSAGAAFTFSNLNPHLQGCPGAVINSITVTTDHSTTPFNVVNAASFGPHSVTVPITSAGGPASSWLSGEFIQIQLNYCEPASTCNVNLCVSPTNGTATATSLNFGSVTAGLTPAASPVRTVTITNCAPMGGANLYVSPGTIPSATRYSFFPDPGPAQAQYMIPPTQSKNFKVRFNPLVAGTSNATWNIYYNANTGSTSNPYVVNLTGTSPTAICDPGAFVQGPLLCDFGNVTVGTTVYKTIFVKNKATSCDDLTFTPGTLAPPYSFITPASYSKVPGDQEIFIVAFSPTAVTTYPAQVWNMTNNSTNRTNPYGITVTGTGVAANICSPILMTGPLHTNFSAIAVNTSAAITNSESKTILIKNTSTTCVLNVTWSPGPVGPFSVDHYSASINPGNTEPFIVTFAPTHTGVGTLDGTNSNWRTWNITHNATNQTPGHTPVFHLKLKGSGL